MAVRKAHGESPPTPTRRESRARRPRLTPIFTAVSEPDPERCVEAILVVLSWGDDDVAHAARECLRSPERRSSGDEEHCPS